MKALVLIAAAFVPSGANPQSSGPEAIPAACPEVTAQDLETQKRNLQANRKVGDRVAALVGVDPLGRVLIALDYGQDDIVDELVLFTPRERLKGPWSELIRTAEVESTAGTFRLEAHDRSTAILLAVNPADVPELKHKGRHYRRLIERKGHELVRNSVDTAYGRRLSSYDHTLLETWPESFREDMVIPQTTYPPNCWNCGNTPCQTGGCFTQQCQEFCTGLIVNDKCQIGCEPGASFACCNCTNMPFFPIARCRCVPCKKQMGPIP
jgi:hypothetical protein